MLFGVLVIINFGAVGTVVMAPAALAKLHLNSFAIKRITAQIQECVDITRWRESADKRKGIREGRDERACLPG